MLCNAPQARQYTHKAVHTQGATHGKSDLWLLAESCYLRGYRQSGARIRRHTRKNQFVATGGVMLSQGPRKAVHTEGGAHIGQNTQKAVCGHRTSHVI